MAFLSYFTKFILVKKISKVNKRLIFDLEGNGDQTELVKLTTG